MPLTPDKDPDLHVRFAHSPTPPTVQASASQQQQPSNPNSLLQTLHSTLHKMSSHLSDLPLPILTTSKPPSNSTTNTKPSSPQRPTHQTTRSITETSIPSGTGGKQKHSHHHHPHIHRHHHNKSSERKSFDRDTQSPRTSNLQVGGDGQAGSKSAGATPDESRVVSRNASFLKAGEEVDGLVVPASWREERRVVKEEEVDVEREKGLLGATELRNELMKLNTLSNSTTRRLDNTYYSVLEKLSVLQNTITSLKELAGMTKELNTEFQHESEDVVTEIENSLEGFQGFEEQQKRIEGLAERVKVGREKIKMLGDRVEVVKERVDGWETADREGQVRKKKRLRIMWGFVGFVGIVVLAVAGLKYSLNEEQGWGALEGLNETVGKSLPDFKRIRNETWTLKENTVEALEKMREKTKDMEELPEDPRLRLFDEL